MIHVDRRLLLEFFDTVPPGSGGHATAVCAVAGEDLGAGLIKHYLERECGVIAEVLPESCTPGTRSGERLDRWIVARDPERSVLYQVEIKSWSAHAIGGRKLALDAPSEVVAAFKAERWGRIWQGDSLRHGKLGKVLIPMRPPKDYAHLAVEPVACLWNAMHPTGGGEPWNTAVLPTGSAFPVLHVFSMSGYLRGLQEPYLDLDMPEATARLRWLGRLFRSPEGEPSGD